MNKPADPETLLAALVGFDTTSRHPNRALIDFIRNYLSDLKIESTVVTGNHEGKACLWATVGPPEEKGIVLAGHTDTVPVDGQNWSSDPFALTARADKLYARGACDMKGFIACALAVVGEYAKKPRRRPLHLAFTHDEETTMEGAQNLTDYVQKKGLKPAWVWIGEPTLLTIVDAHKGVAAFRTDIKGIAGHSSQPDHGLNAISLGARFIDIVESVAEERRQKPFKDSRFTPPYTTFNLATIKGGTAENIIAEHCEILWQVRAHPGDDLAGALQEIETRAQRDMAPRFKAFAPASHMKTCTCFDIPSLTATKDNEGRDVLQHLTGVNSTEAVSFATEGGFFQKLGGGVVVCGPGSIEQAHKADEYVEKSQLAACVGLLRRVFSASADRVS
jgi:acetylornithine deacetylase